MPSPFIPTPTPGQAGYDLRAGYNGGYELVPGAPANVPSPARLGLTSWAFDPNMASDDAVYSGEILRVSSVDIGRTTRVAGVAALVQQPAALTNAVFALYDSTGRLLGQTANVGAQFANVGLVRADLLVQVTLQPGSYYVALLLGTTGAHPLLYATGRGGVSAVAPPYYGDLPWTAALPPDPLPIASLSPVLSQLWVGLY